MSLHHLFVIDPLASLNLKLDSSLRLMNALTHLGHQVHVCEPRQLSWSIGSSVAQATCQELHFARGPEAFTASEPRTLGLDHFAAVHMRKDPPYDLDYIGTTWLLDGAPPTTRVYNAPESLRRFNEKLAIFHFPDAVRPGLVSADPDALLAFVEGQAQGDAVIKPLTLFGGRGVLRLQVKDQGASRAEVRHTLVNETANGTQMRLVQGFDPAIFDGEVRVFTAFGRPVASCLKRPEAGNFLANTRAGAKLMPYEPTAVETDRVVGVARQLLRSGVVFVGFDIIGGYISEINITSPRLLVAPGDSRDYYADMAEDVAKDLAR